MDRCRRDTGTRTALHHLRSCYSVDFPRDHRGFAVSTACWTQFARWWICRRVASRYRLCNQIFGRWTLRIITIHQCPGRRCAGLWPGNRRTRRGCPTIFGGRRFQAYDVEVLLPFFGHVHFASALVFDVGVYLVVIGLILDVLRSLGSAIDARYEAETRDRAETERRMTAARASASAPGGHHDH